MVRAKCQNCGKEYELGKGENQQGCVRIMKEIPACGLRKSIKEEIEERREICCTPELTHYCEAIKSGDISTAEEILSKIPLNKVDMFIKCVESQIECFDKKEKG